MPRLVSRGLVRTSTCRKWIVPAYTFAATALAVQNAGVPFSFADVDESTWFIEGRSADKNSGVLAVAPFGASVDLDIFSSSAEVVWDAAASLGNLQSLNGISPNQAVVFSLHATKVFPAGEGGLLVLGSNERAQAIRRWQNFAFEGTRVSVGPGTNAKMSEIHAAYGLASLENRELEMKDWQELRSYVAKKVSRKSIWMLSPRGNGVNPYWICTAKSTAHRIRIEKSLAHAGIASRRWWSFLPSNPAFQDVCRLGDLPVARKLSETVLGLPFFRRPSERSSVAYVSDVVQRA